MQQQFALAARLGNNVGRCLIQWGDQRTREPGFATVEVDVGIHKLHFAFPQGLYFPTGQGNACLHFIFQEKFVAGLLVLGDGCRTRL